MLHLTVHVRAVMKILILNTLTLVALLVPCSFQLRCWSVITPRYLA